MGFAYLYTNEYKNNDNNKSDKILYNYNKKTIHAHNNIISGDLRPQISILTR